MRIFARRARSSARKSCTLRTCSRPFAGAKTSAYVEQGTGTVEDALHGVFSLYVGDDTRALFEWLRAFNVAHPDDPDGVPPKKKSADKPSKESVELFNLKDDPFEKTNLADKHPDRVKEMAAAWQKQTEAITALARKDLPAEKPAK